MRKDTKHERFAKWATSHLVWNETKQCWLSKNMLKIKARRGKRLQMKIRMERKTMERLMKKRQQLHKKYTLLMRKSRQQLKELTKQLLRQKLSQFVSGGVTFR